MKKSVNPFDSSLILIILESLLLFGVSIAGYYLRFYGNIIPVKFGIPPLTPYLLLFIVQTILWLFLFDKMNLYRKHFFISVIDEWYSIFLALLIGTLIILAFTFFYRTFTFSRILLVQNLFLIFFVVAIIRLIFYKLSEKFYLKGYGVEHAIIVGKTDDEILNKRIKHLNRLGYVIDKVYENLDDINFKDIRTLFWNIDKFSISKLSELYEKQIIPLNIKVNFISNFFAEVSSRWQTYNVAGLPIMYIHRSKIKGINNLIKRLFDIIFSLFAIILLLIPWIIIAILVKLSSKGPIFYLQERITKDEKLFKIIKFRTMRVDAEKQTGPKWAEKDDPRRTKIGAFLRKTSLDETPQFINVLLGQMSIVGPRPERPVFVEKFKKEIPSYSLRHQVRAGITGWAQINGWRGNTSIKERVLFDLFYINNWSLLFDIKIVLRTIFELFFQKEAY